MIKVGWPADRTEGTRVPVWRVLDLSGMTKSIRQSKNVTRAGFMFLNGSRIKSLKKTLPLGEEFTLELRWPNGPLLSAVIMMVPINRHAQLQRSNTPRQLNYRG